eukprot:TRINITY_DN57_c0_g1_i3.p1 TRINITY_DN57_c0_g1~~TRINITY_DN57_c0_g1_i3.p1  ORF type:complete len:313 (+),score=146.69 TRINITY_DN57_c0_g1_i3:64-1002(+)
MKAIAILLLVAIVGALASRPILDRELVELINSNPSSTWKAGLSPRFHGMTVEEVKAMLSHLPPQKPSAPLKTYAAPRAIPANFDSRTQFEGCIGNVRDQGDCGSGWAFASTGVLQDRFCIATSGKVSEILSPQDIISCDHDDQGCDGGYLNVSWQYLFVTGVVTETCFPYFSVNGEIPACRSTCQDGEEYSKYRAATNYQLYGVSTIQADIAKNGPVQAGVSVYEDFIHYAGGVYSHTNGTYLGDHSVKLVGWGVDQTTGTPYWLAQNSWGQQWGEKGMVRIVRGVDEISIEDSVYAGLPATNSRFVAKNRK